MDIEEILNQQKAFFASGETQNVKYRIEALKKLKNAIIESQTSIYSALRQDLNKTEIESYMCEVKQVLNEIDFCTKHLKRWAKPKRVKTELANFPAKSYSLPVPKGCVLIMSPWNYPIMLTLEPLVDTLAAGNTAVLKPSAYSPASSKVVCDIIAKVFETKYVAVLTGGREVNQQLLDQKFDHIFFTGSKAVGHEVLRRAEPNMIPVTLELGGKSPCIVDQTADIKLAAKRIVFGKFLNCGQTCVAPDYVLVHESVKDRLTKELIREIKMQYGLEPLGDHNYGKIISEKHFMKILELLKHQKVIYGGKYAKEHLKIEPTLIDEPALHSPVMTEEIFGPVLPILPFKELEQAINVISLNPTPLALYVFSKDKKTIKTLINNVQFGGGCVNDTVMHVATNKMAFGGIGTSGMGAYHGKRGFDTFSHYKSIINKSLKIDLPIRYRPITKKKEKIIKKVL